jgi:hypothetical protein
MGELYTRTNKTEIVFRVFDPVEQKYCATGHSLYGKGRSIWLNAGGASLAKRNMPDEIKERLIIKRFRLVELD